MLVSKNLKLEWNYDAGNLVNGKGNQPVGLDSKISWDDEGGKGDGHYEYDRGNSNNCPDKSAYYKLTGTVAYDPIKENGSIKLYQGQRGDYWTPGISAEDEAINAYLKATGSNKTAASLTKKSVMPSLAPMLCRSAPPAPTAPVRAAIRSISSPLN